MLGSNTLAQRQYLFVQLAQQHYLRDILQTNQRTLEMLRLSVTGTLRYVTDSQKESGHHIMAKCFTIHT